LEFVTGEPQLAAKLQVLHKVNLSIVCFFSSVVSFMSGMITELLQNLISKTQQARYPLIGRVGKYG